MYDFRYMCGGESSKILITEIKNNNKSIILKSDTFEKIIEHQFQVMKLKKFCLH